MALQTYADLQTALGNWLGRAGDALVTTNAPDWITLCESRIAYGSGDPDDEDASFFTKPLRIRAMETTAEILIGTPLTGATVGGTANAITLTPLSSISSYTNGLLYQFVATASNTGAATLNVDGIGAVNLTKGSSRSALSANDIVSGGTYNVYYDGINAVWVLMFDGAHAPLPANYLSMRSFWYYWQTFIQPLEFLVPDAFNTYYINQTNGPPRQYTIEADNLRFGPVPDSTYYAPCTYYQKFAALSTGNNWLMTNAPNVYLFGSLLEACIFLDDDRQAQKYLRLYRAACNALQSQDENDRHSGASLRVRNDTGSP